MHDVDDPPGRCLAIVAAARATDASDSRDLVDAGIETLKDLDPAATEGCFG